MSALEIIEVGPRDGLQNEATTLSIDQRVAFIRRLVDAGVTRMESVSFVHPTRVPQMAGAEEVMRQVPHDRGVSYIGLVVNRRGAERAAQSTVQEINVIVPVSDSFSHRNQGRSTLDMMAEAEACVAVAREAGLRSSISLAVAFGCPFEGHVRPATLRELFHRAVGMGVDEIAFADTIGVAVPAQIRAAVELGASALDGASLRFHLHNTRNTGYSNALTAVAANGGRMDLALDSAVGGFGGCPFAPNATGNIGTEDLLYSLENEYDFRSGISVDGLIDTARWLSGQLGSPIQSYIPQAGWFSLGRIDRGSAEESDDGL